MEILINIAFAIILIVLLIVYENKWKVGIKCRWLKIAITVVFATVIAPSIFALLMSWYDYAEKQKEMEFRNAVMDAIEEGQTDTGALNSLIKLKYREVFNATEDRAEEWVKQFFETMTDKASNLEKLHQYSEDLSRRLISRWEPFYDYVLTSLDERIKAISSKVDVKYLIRLDYKKLLGNEPVRKKTRIRIISFPSGGLLSVDLDQGRIERGLLVRPPQLIFREERKGNTDIIFVVVFQKDHVAINLDSKHSTLMKQDNYRKLEGELMSEQNTKAVTEAINHTLEYLYFLK